MHSTLKMFRVRNLRIKLERKLWNWTQIRQGCYSGMAEPEALGARRDGNSIFYSFGVKACSRDTSAASSQTTDSMITTGPVQWMRWSVGVAPTLFTWVIDCFTVATVKCLQMQWSDVASTWLASLMLWVHKCQHCTVQCTYQIWWTQIGLMWVYQISQWWRPRTEEPFTIDLTFEYKLILSNNSNIPELQIMPNTLTCYVL